MLRFVARAFEGFLGVILWINWIGSAITCAVMGWRAGGGGYAVLGFMLGAVAGIITNIVFGGLIVTFVNMSKEISEIRDYVRKGSSLSVGSDASGSRICPSCKKQINAYSIVCTYCNATI